MGRFTAAAVAEMQKAVPDLRPAATLLFNVRRVTWQQLVGVATTGRGNSLVKTAAAGFGNAGASSVEKAVSGECFAEFTADETDTDRVCGLSSDDFSQTVDDIDYAIRLTSAGQVDVLEAGTPLASSVATYASGDVFRVSFDRDGKIRFWRNGDAIYTHDGTPFYPARVDCALDELGATLQDVKFGGAVRRLTTLDAPLSSDVRGSFLGRVSRWGSIEYSAGDHAGGVQSLTGSIEVEDPDGDLAEVLREHSGADPENTVIQLALASETLGTQDWPDLFTGRVQNRAVPGKARRWRLGIRPLDEELEFGEHPSRVVSLVDFPNAPPVSAGVPVPEVLGRHNSYLLTTTGAVKCLRVGALPGALTCGYMVSAAGLAEVPRVYLDKVITDSADWDLVRLTVGGYRYTFVDFAVDPDPEATKTVTADAYGMTVAAAPLTSAQGADDGAGDLVINPAAILRHWLCQFALGKWKAGAWFDEDLFPLDVASWAAAEAFFRARGVRASLWTGKERRPIDAVSEFCEAWWIRAYWDHRGKIALGVSDPARSTVYVSADRWIRQEQEGAEQDLSVEFDGVDRVEGYTVNYALEAASGGSTRATLEVGDGTLLQLARRVHKNAWHEYSPAYDPATEYSGLRAWWPVWKNSGADVYPFGPVGTLKDRKNAYDLSAASTARPTLQPGQANGRPALRFDGSNDELTGTAISNLIAADQCRIWVVFRATAIAGAAANIYDDAAILCDSGGVIGLHVRQVLGVYYLTAYSWDGAARTCQTPISLNTWYAARYRHQGGNLYLSVNGGPEVSAAAGDVTSLAGNIVWGRNYLSAAFFQGEVAEVLVFNNGDLMNQDHWDLPLNLAEMYGLTVSTQN